MIKDRRVLVEAELKKAKATASYLYLKSVTSDPFGTYREAYEEARNKLVNLETDLAVIDNLIADGVE